MKNKDLIRGRRRKNVGRCVNCDKQIPPYRKFCTLICCWKNKIGKQHGWGNKISQALAGKRKSKEHVAKVAKALTGRKRPEITGEKHYGWKGNKIQYGSLHDWVAAKLGRPKKCVCCGRSSEDTIYQWSNISGEYKRDLSDWERLCVKCHRLKDRNKNRAGRLYTKHKRGKGYTNRIVL